jgi:hypothetical protein
MLYESQSSTPSSFMRGALFVGAAIVMASMATEALAERKTKGMTISFPKNVSGASFIRACENSGGSVDSAGSNHLSCSNKNGTTDCATTDSGNLDVCTHTPPRKRPAKWEQAGGSSHGNGGADAGQGGGNASGQTQSASGGNESYGGSMSGGGSANGGTIK